MTVRLSSLVLLLLAFACALTLAAAHAVTGAVGVALGVFIIIAAGRLTSRGQSVARYKSWMRGAYVVYLLAMVLGVWVYVGTYG